MEEIFYLETRWFTTLFDCSKKALVVYGRVRQRDKSNTIPTAYL